LAGKRAMSFRVSKLVFAPTPSQGVEFVDAAVPDRLDTPPLLPVSFLNDLRFKLLSDEHLAQRLQVGHADALTILFERHSMRLFRTARRILRNDAEAEDTVQTIFLDVYRAIGQFDAGKGEFKSWLYLFAYQRIFNSRRRLTASRFFAAVPLEDLDEILQKISNPGEGKARYSPEESRILLRQVMRNLEPRQRRTIELIYYDGCTAEEVSIQTGETVRVVRHNLYRGLDKLRKVLFAEEISRRSNANGGSQ
jgi:RNA polymerase sigma-70 factor (ECF subfamily)